MITFNFDSSVEKFYPYRTALLKNSIQITLDDKDIRHIDFFLERNGYRMDNHICWKDNKGMCFMYSDGKLGLGTEIIEENW